MLLLHQRHEFQNEEIAATLLLTGSSDRTILVSLLIQSNLFNMNTKATEPIVHFTDVSVL